MNEIRVFNIWWNEDRLHLKIITPITLCFLLPEVYTCDTESDCFNGADESNCPTDCSGEHQFKCDSDNKLVPEDSQDKI